MINHLVYMAAWTTKTDRILLMKPIHLHTDPTLPPPILQLIILSIAPLNIEIIGNYIG